MTWQPTRHGMLLVIVGCVAVLLLQLEAINDVDIHWQIRLGQLALEQGSLVTQDVFTYTHAGDPVPTIGWLAQILFALLYGLGSWRAVQIVHVLLFTGAFVVAGISAIRGHSSNDRSIGLFALTGALFLAFVAGASNSMVRPQSFGIFCFACLLAVVNRKMKLSKKLCLIIPLTLFWQNTHPSVVVGAVAVAALLAAGWFCKLRDRSSAAPWDLTLLLGIVALAQFATPMGWRVFETSSVNLHIARDVLGVTEWLPPWKEGIREAMFGFALAMAVTLALIAKLRRRIQPAELALFVMMTCLALTAGRFAVFWALAMVPIWARWIELAKPAEAFQWAGDLPMRKKTFSLLAGLFVAAALSVPTLLQGPVKDQFALAEGIGRLKELLPAGRIYNYREWAGPLILAGHPNWRVAIDGRLYLYPERDWLAYSEEAAGKVPLSELQSQYRPDAFFLKPSFDQELINILQHSMHWREAYADRNCSVFVKNH